MGVPLRVLVLEDSQTDTELVVAELRRAGFDPDWVRVETERDYLAELDTMPEIILSDYAMPQFDAARALQLLKERGLDVPFIIVSGTIGEEVAVEAMRQGAADYLLKNRLARLGQAVSHALEQNRAEQRLRLQAAALDSAANAIVITDRDGRITWVNPAFARLTGYSLEEAVGQNPRLLKSGEQDPDFYRDLWQAVLAGRVWHGELVNRRKDDSLYVEQQSITPVRDEHGEITHFVAVKQDITERRRFQETLRQSEERYRLLAESTLTGVYLIQDGLFRYVNPSLAATFGYGVEEVAGKLGPLDLTAPEDRPLVAENIRKRVQGEARDIRYSFRGLRKDGTLIDVEVHGARIDYEGRSAVIGTLLDITERKRAEEEIRALNADLERRVAERTTDLREATEVAKRAKEEAERANRAKDEFLSRMSHELRTPLNSVLGFAQVMETEDLKPEQRDSVRQILRGGWHLLGLIDEVLDISRIATGTISFSPESVRVREVVNEAMELIQPLADQRDVVLRAEDANGLHVLADRQRLKQVVLNLLSNAVKFSQDGGQVRVSWEKAAEGRLRLRVTDEGPGIPDDRLDRLFVPFDRLGAEQSGVEGTGLGLPLSKALVEAMGGSMHIESRVGVGSTFAIELALAEPPVDRYEREQESAAVAGPGGEGRTVLHIEDNLSNLALIERVLNRFPDVRLLSAMQGRLGLDLAREHLPDLILLDLHLPDISGEEALRNLREDPLTTRIPVVVISADATPVHVKRLLAAGAHDYMTKPLDVKRFLDVVGGTLGRD